MNFKDEIKEQKEIINAALRNIYKLAALNGFESHVEIKDSLYAEVKITEEL